MHSCFSVQDTWAGVPGWGLVSFLRLRGFLQGLALAAVVVLGAHLHASWVLQRQILGETSLDMARWQRGESRLSRDFSDRGELVGGRVEGASLKRDGDGRLRVRLDGEQADLRINFRGEQLDARRYRWLDLDLSLSRDARLTLIFHERGAARQLGSGLDLAAGRVQLRLDLDGLSWDALAAAGELPPTEQEAPRWGGGSGWIDQFRLHLGAVPGTEIDLGHLRFLRHPQGAPGLPQSGQESLLQWTEPAACASHAQAGPAPGAKVLPPAIRLPLGGLPIERVLAERDRCRTVDPDTLFWPAAGMPPTALDDPGHRPWQAWEPAPWSVALLGLLMLASLLHQRVANRPGGRPSRRRHDLAALVLGAGSIAWLVVGMAIADRPGTAASALLAMATGYMLLSLRDTRTATGRGPAPQAWRAALLPTLALLLAMATLGLVLDQQQWPGLRRTLGYLPFVLLQQLLLLRFLLPRAERLWPRQGAALAASIFALLHAPNFALMLFSLAAAWFWCALYLRHRRLLPILVSHYLLGLAAVTWLRPEVLYSAEAGLRFLLLR